MSRPTPAFVRDATRWVREKVKPRTDLTACDKLVAQTLAYARWGHRTVSLSREDIARRAGVSVRTVQRSVPRLERAGLIWTEEKGRIEAGRRFRSVFRLLSPLVSRGDRKSPLSSSSTKTTTRRTPLRTQLSPEIPLPDWTRARQPRPNPSPAYAK